MRATLKLLERQGMSGLTIEGIAAEAGVGKATIYRWWPSRTAVVLEAIELLPELEPPDRGSFAADLRELLGNFAELLESTPLGGVLAHLGGDPTNRDPEVDAYLSRRMAGVMAVVERAVARDELPNGTDPASVVYVAMGPILNRSFYGPPCDDAFLDFVVATITGGVPSSVSTIRTDRAARP